MIGRFCCLLPVIMAIAGNSRASEVFGMEPDWTYDLPASGCNIRLAAGLLDSDQYLDMVVGLSDTDNLKVFLGCEDGTFIPGDEYYLGGDPQWIEFGDVDGDGHEDVVVRNYLPYSPDSFAVFMNDQSGILDDPIVSPDPGGPGSEAFCFCHFNDDSHLDIMTVTLGYDGVVVMYGDGSGSFSQESIYEDPPYGVRALDCEDIDGDGDEDIVLVVSNELAVLLNNGDSTVTLGGTYGGFPNEMDLASLEIEHLDQDGIYDIATAPGASYGELSIQSFLGDGDGGFEQVSYGWVDLGISFTQTDINDYDLDGCNDAMFNGHCGNLLMLGDGTGNLTYDYYNYHWDYCWEAVTADLDLDGDIDYVTASAEDPPIKLEVFLNKTIQTGIEGPVQVAQGGMSALKVAENPFHGTVRIHAEGIDLPETLTVYDLSGREVAEINNRQDGEYVWDGRDNSGLSIPSGLYVVSGIVHGNPASVRVVKL